MNAVAQWGPALVVVFSIFLGIVFNNRRLDDFRNNMDGRFVDQGKRFDDLNKRIDDVNQRIDEVNQRIDEVRNDLKDFIRSEVKRLEDRIDQRLVRP